MDQSTLQIRNMLAIIENVFTKGVTSRAQLSRDISISKPTVVEYVNPLLNLGIISEDTSQNYGGRKPRPLLFNYSYRYILTADLRYEIPFFALCDLNCRIVGKLSIKASQDASSDTLTSMFINAFNLLLNANNIRPDEIAAIAISAPGIYMDGFKRSFTNKQHTRWDITQIANSIKDQFDIPVLCCNYAKASVYGEHSAGKGMGVNNLVYLKCGIGIGMGIFLNGKLFEGIDNSAGEVFNFIDPTKLSINTTLEKVTSLNTLIQNLREDNIHYSASYLSSFDRDTLNIHQVAEAYLQGDSYVFESVSVIAREIGCVAANVANLLTAEMIIVGGEYIEFKERFIDDIETIVNKYCLRPPEIVASNMDNDAVTIGLCVLARDKFFINLAEGIFNDNE